MDVSPAWILDHITLPALREFNCFQEQACWPQSQFISLLSRSSCTLQSLSLSLDDGIIEDDDFINILQLTPALCSLMLSGAPWELTDVVLGRLSLRVSEGEEAICLLPKLHHISVVIGDEVGFNNLAFTYMIESRWAIGPQTEASPFSRIQSVEVKMNDCEFDPVALARMDQLSQEGLDVSIYNEVDVKWWE
jgi:hypothetical protein